MFQRMLASAVFAGAAAGLIAALLHFAFVQQFILLGEQYETGALSHFSTGSVPSDAVAVDGSQAGHANVAGTAEAVAGHAHSRTVAPSDLKRNALTVLFMVLVYVSYGMLMTAGFGLAESLGHRIGPATGMLWGIAGFAAFQMVPAMGLAPELPGTIAADLGARQVWWWATVVATVSAIALLAYGRQTWAFVVAGVVLALPHVIGAPQPDGFFGLAPPEVAAAFTARVLGAGLAVWACLGWLAGHFWARSAQV